VFISALPQSTAEVEKALFRCNNNKNKLRNRLAVCTFLKTIIKSGDNLPGDFETNQRLTDFHGKARKTNFEKFDNSEGVDAITEKTFSL